LRRYKVKLRSHPVRAAGELPNMPPWPSRAQSRRHKLPIRTDRRAGPVRRCRPTPQRSSRQDKCAGRATVYSHRPPDKTRGGHLRDNVPIPTSIRPTITAARFGSSKRGSPRPARAKAVQNAGRVPNIRAAAPANGVVKIEGTDQQRVIFDKGDGQPCRRQAA
jgi:hypothetical protein